MVDERAIAAQADVVGGWMHQEARRRRDRLTVHVRHRGLCCHGHRQPSQSWIVDSPDVDLQVVRATGVSDTAELCDGRLAAAAVCAAGRLKRRSVECRATVGAVATVAAVAVSGVRDPPRRPDAECVVLPPRGRIAGRRSRHLPIHWGGAERATCVVGGIDGDCQWITLDIRSDALAAGTDLKVRSAELLDLERMLERPRDAFRPAEDELHGRVSEVRVDGNHEREVESAERVDSGGPGTDRYALRIGRREGDRCAVRRQPQLRIGARVEPTDPPFDRHRLARLVRLTIIECVPRHLITDYLALPRPAVEPVGQQCDVVTLCCEQGRNRCVAEAEDRQAVDIRRGRHGRPVDERNGDSGQRCTRRELRRPRVQIAGVGQCVETDVGGLCPRDGRTVHPTDRIVDAVLLGRFDNDYHMSESAREVPIQVDRGLHRLVGAVVDSDSPVVHNRPWRRCWSVRALRAPEQLLHIQHVRRPVLRRHGKDPHPEVVVVDRDHRQRTVSRQWVECRERLGELLENRGCLTDLHASGLRCGELLPVDVPESGGNRDRVGPACLGRALDVDRRSVHADHRSGDRGFDLDRGWVERGRVDLVVEVDRDPGPRRTVRSVRAHDVDNHQWGVGVACVVDGSCGHGRPLL